MYHNKIKNPATGRWVNANGTIGKKLQQRSDMQVGGVMNNFSNKAAYLASKTPQAKLLKRAGVDPADVAKKARSTVTKAAHRGKQQVSKMNSKRKSMSNNNMYTLKNIYLMNWEIYRMLQNMNSAQMSNQSGGESVKRRSKARRSKRRSKRRNK